MKFIHLADVHLGAVPDRGTAWSSAREEEIWSTFRRVIAEIRDNPVDLLFIAGDLFHRQPLLRELREVNRLFESIPDTNVYLIAGNHDFMGKESAYRHFRWAENVVFFDSEELMCIDDDKAPVTVYGFSFLHQEIKEPLLDGVCPENSKRYHILLAHGGDEKHVPIDMDDLSEAGFDYAALGHIHKPKVIRKNKAAYAGALEPIDRNDLGPHGYIRGWTKNGEIKTRFVPFAERSYMEVLLKLNEGRRQVDLEKELARVVEANGQENIYRVILTGERSPDLMLIPEKLKTCGNVIDVRDDTRLPYDLEMLKKQYAGTLIGDYIRYFTMREMTETDRKALYYGLQALLETSR